MPAAGSAVDGPGHRARVGRASCPPSGPLRPRMITGGARGPDRTMWWVAALPARVVSPPAPVGGAGRESEKGIAAAAAGRGPRRPVGPGPRPVARPALLAGCGRHRAGRIHCISAIVNVSIPRSGYAKNQQKTRHFRGFRLEAIGRIVVYWCSVRGHRGPGMKVARAGGCTPTRAGSASLIGACEHVHRSRATSRAPSPSAARPRRPRPPREMQSSPVDRRHPIPVAADHPARRLQGRLDPAQGDRHRLRRVPGRRREGPATRLHLPRP